ncbi:MAG: DinB family protein [Bryobacteraceae bacterium]
MLALLCAAVLAAQGPDLKTISGGAKAVQNTVKANILKSAEKMSEENYSFKPTPEVRSFGQLIGHLADANNNACAGAMGVSNPSPGIEKSKTSKADLVAALAAAIAFCDKAYDITDAQAAELVKVRNSERTRLSVLQGNSFHSNLHYGNIITYMRLKGVTPPSSDR